ncbi:reverse transcriptase domain-containing protein [Tanacetum coccineum]
MKKKTCKIKTIQKESVEVEVLKSSTQHSSVNEVFVLNISKEDVESQPNSPPQDLINLDPDDQPIWESAKNVAPTPISAIVRPDVDDNFVINNTHLKMIWENKFDGYLRTGPHDHVREFLAICDMFKYGETQSEAVKFLIFPLSLCDKAKIWFNKLNEESITSWEQMRRAFINKFFPPLLFNLLFKLDWSTKSQNDHHHQKSVAFADGSDSNDDNFRLMEKMEALTIKMDSQFQNLKEEMHEIRKNYNNHGGNHASKNRMNDDTPRCERHEVNSIQLEGYQIRDSHDSYSHQSHHDLNDFGKSLTELVNDVKHDLEDFKVVSVA